ncbi:MAG: hypothetical protein LC687_07610, partial [Actinobacteria bacterium]|nr:hypothetical protein [Actinomycetota bacterium]
AFSIVHFVNKHKCFKLLPLSTIFFTREHLTMRIKPPPNIGNEERKPSSPPQIVDQSTTYEQLRNDAI